uniref:C2 domain-containing protein At1g53590-like n=1 Tax=Ananas comosus var. bracteatus TaxID=296719 RepID=A0A6V7Q7N3_ANACO|nr:unnamed protein product [Ananas comosus var. bracteatus]
MNIMEVSIIHHITLVLALLWISISIGWSHPVLFFVALLYLYLVNERCTLRLQRRLQFEERKCANQRRLLSDMESVRWLNHAVEKIWPICLEKIASQQFLLPIIPWFLDKFKPWTARKAAIQNLYLGRNPPLFTDIRVLAQQADDDHLVLELGLNFMSAEDMSAILAVQLRKRLGFGITANMHVTGMHVEGKVLVGVKFLREWPFIGRVRVCFVEPPYFQMTVKPIFGHGLDVTELPGISGWLDKLLDVAFGQTLVEPNMLVIDVEKFASAPTGDWFTVNEKPPIAYVQLEIIEGANMKPSDLNGLADPYVKAHLGPYRFQTKIQRKTLTPKWLEEFKIPISSWEAQNLLVFQVRDKDPLFDDSLGNCCVDINDLRGGQRHDKWLPLNNIKMGRLHLAITVIEDEPEKVKKDLNGEEEEAAKPAESTTPKSSSTAETRNSNEYLGDGDQKMADEFEPIDIEGQEKTGVWVHRPGSDISQTWEPRKGRARYLESQLLRETNEGFKENPSSPASRSHLSDTSNEESLDVGKSHRHAKLKRGLGKLSSVFHRSPKKGSERESADVPLPTPPPNIRPLGEKRISVKLIVDEDIGGKNEGSKLENENERFSPEKDEGESPGRRHLKDKAKNMVKQAGKSAQSIKGVFNRKSSGKKKEQSLETDERDEADGSNLSNGTLKVDPLAVGDSSIDNPVQSPVSCAK